MDKQNQGIKETPGFGGGGPMEDTDIQNDGRSTTGGSPYQHTRSHGQTTTVRNPGGLGHSGERMDCDPNGASSMQGGQFERQFQRQQQNSKQWYPQYEDHGHPQGGHAGQPWQHPSGHIQHPQPTFGAGQAQAQGHIFRSAQASKQMVYEVYGNCLAMLEELESRELKRHRQQPLPRSGIPMPSQSQHDDSTVQRKLETQLLLFQSQLSSCDKEIKEEVRDELKQNTLVWNGQRESRGLPGGVTDKYAGKLYEVLERGKTEHPKEFYQQPSIDQAGMQRAMQGIVQGNHMRAQLDEDFKKNPKKKAEAHKVRSGGGMDKGAERMARNNPQLQPGLDRYWHGDLK